MKYNFIFYLKKCYYYIKFYYFIFITLLLNKLYAGFLELWDSAWQVTVVKVLHLLWRWQYFGGDNSSLASHTSHWDGLWVSASQSGFTSGYWSRSRILLALECRPPHSTLTGSTGRVWHWTAALLIKRRGPLVLQIWLSHSRRALPPTFPNPHPLHPLPACPLCSAASHQWQIKLKIFIELSHWAGRRLHRFCG